MMNLQQVRVADPVLSNFAQGYRQQRLVGHLLFPFVDVLTRGGKTIEFGKDAFQRYNSRRAPGANVAIATFGYEGKPYDLELNALDGKLPVEHIQEAESVPGVNLGMRSVTTVMNALTLSLECEQAEIARNATNYDVDHKITLDDTSKWSNPDSDPISVIEAGMEAVRKTCGMEPNVAVFGPSAYKALRKHPQILDRFKGILSETIQSQHLAGLFDLEHVSVGKAVYADNSESQSFHDIWGDDVILAYSAQKPSGLEEPSYGYTYRLQGHPVVMKPWYDGGVRSWRYPLSYDRSAVLTSQIAGYLIKDAGAKLTG